MEKKRGFYVAVGGVFSALSFVFLMLTLFPYATYGLAVLAGLMLYPVSRECGRKWGFVAYAAVSLLAFLAVPDLEAKWLFILFFGYYPLIKWPLDLRPKPVGWLIKLALFNAAVVAAYALMLLVFHLDPGVFELFGVNLPAVLLALGNAVFVLYDFVLSRLIRDYEFRWRHVLLKIWRG